MIIKLITEEKENGRRGQEEEEEVYGMFALIPLDYIKDEKLEFLVYKFEILSINIT